MLRSEKSPVSTTRRPGGPGIERQRHVRFSDEIRAELVERYQASALQRELAEANGVNRRTVGAIVARHRARREQELLAQEVEEAGPRHEQGESLACIGGQLGANRTP